MRDVAAATEVKAAMQAVLTGLPSSPVRYLGNQFEKVNPSETGLAKVKQIRQLLHDAGESRKRCILLSRKKGDLNSEQQNAWDADIDKCKCCIEKVCELFSTIEKPKSFKLKDVGDAVAREERNDADELLRLAGRMKRRSQTVQALGEAAADESQIDAASNALESYFAGTASADSQSSTVQV